MAITLHIGNINGEIPRQKVCEQDELVAIGGQSAKTGCAIDRNQTKRE